MMTADGARIACKRKPGNGTPVIFVHGVAVNADLWDIPDIHTERFTFQSLPTLLQGAGYDIWIVNLRGHGAPHMLSTPPDGQSDWTLDHFIAYDLPAVVDHVRSTTRRRPWIIGNSMGAMTAAGYLQGASIVGEGEQPHVVADTGLARCRQDKILGAVLIEFPAALRWPSTLYDEHGNLKWRDLWEDASRTDGGVNYPFELMARSNVLQTIIKLNGAVPLRWMRKDPNAGAWRANLSRPARDALAWADEGMMEATRRFVAAFKGGVHFEPVMLNRGMLPALDDIKAGVIDQLGKCVRRRAFISGLGQPDHVYSDHYQNIECSLLLLSGGQDRIANADVAREAFFEQIRSQDKTLEGFPEIAHGEFEWSPIACEKVYPLIHNWIARRAEAPSD
jgi:pimeloyl-ACP methyl ester carboxylesterase